MEKKTKIIIWAIGFISLLTIGVGGFFLGKEFSNHEDKPNENVNKENDGQEPTYTGQMPKVQDGGKILDNSNSVIQELHGRLELYYIHKIYQGFDSYANAHFYMDKLVNYETLSEEAKLYYAYALIENIERRRFSSCDELKPYSFNGKGIYDECISNPEIIKNSGFEWVFNDINKETLEKVYHKMYGNDKEMPLKQFTMGFSGACVYSEEIDDFLCFNQVGSDPSPNNIETKIEQAIQYDDRIEIYDRYIWYKYTLPIGESHIVNYYKSRFQDEMIVERRFEENSEIYVSDDIFEQGALYKHIFKKDENGNYYWYSSERI